MSSQANGGAGLASPPVGADVLLQLADDELVRGWSDSEWTGIAPFLEEDVAFSSIAQTEIGHARALYEVAAKELGTDADALAFDRAPEEYRCAPLVELRLVPDWGKTTARHFLYETADAIRIADLRAAGGRDLAGLAEKIEREEAYHLLHAEMWVDRLARSQEGREHLLAGLDALWPLALGLVEDEQRERFVADVRLRLPFFEPRDGEAVTRGEHVAEWPALWDEMTMVRRSAPGGSW